MQKNQKQEPAKNAFAIVHASDVSYEFDRRKKPVATISSGSIVQLETDDSSYARAAAGVPLSEIDRDWNAITGPVYVEGVEPGDALAVEILDIHILRAWSIWIPNFGLLGEHTDELKVSQLALEDSPSGELEQRWGQRRVEEGVDKGGGQRRKRILRLSPRLTVPVEEMIGCIGVAPTTGRASTLAPCYAIGGNMDLRQLSIGATIWLPVEVAGGLLSVGDVHCAQGVGEPASAAIESSAVVTLRISVLKAKNLVMPRVLVNSDVYFLGIDKRSRGDAQELAMEQAYKYLTEDLDLEPFEAYAFICARVSMINGGPACPIVLAHVPHPFPPQTQTIQPNALVDQSAPSRSTALHQLDQLVECLTK